VSRDEREHGSRTLKTRRDVRTSESRNTIPNLYMAPALYLVSTTYKDKVTANVL